MHPGPINRGVEITSEVADSEQAIILNQVENGVAIRMAVLYLLASKKKIMQYQVKHHKDTLVVDVHDLTINLAHIIERQNSFKHLIIDLSVFDSVSEDLLKTY